MESTRRSLLMRVKDPNDREAWDRFYELYAPLLFRYARARGLGQHDAEEVRDECLAVVARKIGAFEYDSEKGRFKAWLHRIVNGKVIDLLRSPRAGRAGTTVLSGIEDPTMAPDEEVWEREWRDEHLRFCLARVRSQIPERSFRVFWMLLFEERSVEEVCGALSLNANQVYKAKSQVLQRVRKVLARVEAGAIRTGPEPKDD